MIEVDMRNDQFLCAMRGGIGFCDVLHSVGRLSLGDKVEVAGFVFEVDRVIEGDGMDKVWLKKRVANCG